MTDTAALSAHKTMLRGGFAAAAPGLAAMVAATTVAPSTLSAYTGMGDVGVAALGVVFFFLAFLFARGRWWTGIPGLLCVAWTTFFFSVKAIGLLMRYYQFNPILGYSDLIAPFSVISLHLCLVMIAVSLGWIILKALTLAFSTGPQPVNKLVWGALGIWLCIVIWQGATGGVPI